MVKKGYTAVACLRESTAWRGRRSLSNETKLPVNTRGEVISSRRDDSGMPIIRAIIDGQTYTLSYRNWTFTPIRVGELRRWLDGREPPFMVVSVEWNSCRCMASDGNFALTHRYAEDYTEVISEAR